MAKIHAQQKNFEQRAAQNDISCVIRVALSFFLEFEKKNHQIFNNTWVKLIKGIEYSATHSIGHTIQVPTHRPPGENWNGTGDV
jgi:hypothetical protein